jgi:hypothetical protein
MSMKNLMETDKQELISKGQLVKSPIDGVSDFIWSFGRRLHTSDDAFEEWLCSPVPFLGDRAPFDVLKNDENGEEIIYDLFIRIIFGAPS